MRRKLAKMKELLEFVALEERAILRQPMLARKWASMLTIEFTQLKDMVNQEPFEEQPKYTTVLEALELAVNEVSTTFNGVKV